MVAKNPFRRHCGTFKHIAGGARFLGLEKSVKAARTMDKAMTTMQAKVMRAMAVGEEMIGRIRPSMRSRAYAVSPSTSYSRPAPMKSSRHFSSSFQHHHMHTTWLKIVQSIDEVM